MTHWILSLLEYGLMPLFLVFATVVVRSSTYDTARIEWKEFLSIGLDLVLMCVFGTFIYGLSVFNHYESNVHAPVLMIYCACLSFILLITAITLARLTRHWGPKSLKTFWVPNIVGMIALSLLLFVISTGNNLINGYHSK